MTAGRRLVDALVAVASRYEPAARKEKLRLLGALAGRRLGRPRALLRLHETLCFLQAYPDDPEVLEHVDRALAEFPRRVARLRAAARGRLHDSGIVNTTLDYPFGLPMARWLSTRFPRDCEVAWARFVDTERLDETLSLLAAAAEGDAFSEGGMGWRAWLRVAKGGRRMSDLQLLLEVYYAFLALKNGIPVAYGGGWELFGTLDFAVNVFAAFRQGESAFVATELLRAYRRIFGMRTVVVDRYQLGHESAEALRSGSFYFYHRLGFRPRDPVVLRVLAAEQSKITADRSYRSPIPVLTRLAGAEVYLTLPGGHPEPEKRLRATDVSGLVARLIARDFGGDRRVAVEESTARARRVLGVSGWTAWPAAERRAFARLSLVAALITDLERWPSAERRRLVRVFRAKGCGSERAYANLLVCHRRFRRSLEALVT